MDASQHSSITEPIRPGPIHRCRLCARTYERADHLNRHLKSHENARPHKCSRCSKSFNRADLLNRHQASHDRQGSDKSATRIERGERVAAACLACVASKSKCQDQKPCARCMKKGISCETPNTGVQPILPPQHSSSIPYNTPNQSSYQGPAEIGSPFLANILNEEAPNHATTVMYENAPRPGTMVEHPAMSNQHPTNTAPMVYPMSNYYQQDQLPNTQFASYDDLSFLDPQLSHGFGFTPRDAYFTQDMDFGMWDIDLDSTELAYPNTDNRSHGRRDSQLTPSISSSAPKDASKRYAAFERSPWLWKPTQKDQALNDQHALDLDEDSISLVLTPESPAAAATIPAPTIQQKHRDQMLSLLLTLRQTPDQIPHFPSLSLLNSIIQVYFTQESFKVDSLIHRGTFDTSKALPHLLIAIVSAGATLISYPSIWKMGMALQEVVRHTCANFWEQDNRNTRHLQSLQAFMIGLDVGLWSGFKRKMELAESFAQPIVSMLRRAGAFAPAPNSSLLEPHPGDSDTTLESKWRKWAERESFKRLVLHLFIHDTQVSTALQKPPLMSITELKFPLPCSSPLWTAPTALTWSSLFLSLSSSSSTTTTPPLTLLSAYSPQIHAHHTSRKFFSPNNSTHALCLHTSHGELTRDLSTFCSLIPSLLNPSPSPSPSPRSPQLLSSSAQEIMLLAHHTQLTLQISPLNLHRFAGKFGDEEARLAALELSLWRKSREGRDAVWFAGQVFRIAEGLGGGLCRGVVAMGVYYAALTLWAFGIGDENLGTGHTVGGKGGGNGDGNGNVGEVVLNGDDTDEVGLFRIGGQGVSGLMVRDEAGEGEGKRFLSLAESDGVLAFARDIYRRNFGVGGDRGKDEQGLLPPLVENLGILLRDLGGLTSGRGSREMSEDDS